MKTISLQDIHQEAEHLQKLSEELVPREIFSATAYQEANDPKLNQAMKDEILEAMKQDLEPDMMNLLKDAFNASDQPVPADLIEEDIDISCNIFFHDWVSAIYQSVDYLGGEAELDGAFGPKVAFDLEGTITNDVWMVLNQDMQLDALQLEQFKQEFTNRVKDKLPLKLVRGITIESTESGYVARGPITHAPPNLIIN